MGFWERMFRRKNEAKGLSISLEPGGFVTEVRSYRRPSYPDADTAAAQDAQQRNELVFACIDVKATSAQDPRLIVQQAKTARGKTSYEEQPGHPMRQLLMRPNPQMTEADLMQAAIVSWDVSNPRRFYAEKEYTNNLLTAIWPLNPAQMRPLRSRVDSRKQIGYAWSDGIERKEYAFEDLIIRSAPAWYDPPPMVAAIGNVALDSAQTDHVRAFFANGGIPPGILKYKSAKLRQDQRDEIREKWRATYGNAWGRQFDVGVLDSEVDFQELGAPLDKLASPMLRSVSESRICMAFGVPPLIVYAYVGLLRATYSNLKEAWRGFWDATMSPAFREWRSFWTWHLLIEFEEERDIRSERVRLYYDMSQVAALQEDVDAAQNRAEKAFRAGGITLNEYRDALGRAPDAAGDYYLRLLAYAPQAAGQGPLVSADQVLGGGKRLWPGVTLLAKDRTRPSVQLIERRIEKAMAEYLADEYRAAAAAVRG